MAMNASWIAPYFWFSDMAMAPAESSGVVRSSKGFSTEKTMPALDELEKPAMDRPGKATALSTPGSASVISVMRRDYVLRPVERGAVG